MYSSYKGELLIISFELGLMKKDQNAVRPEEKQLIVSNFNVIDEIFSIQLYSLFQKI